MTDSQKYQAKTYAVNSAKIGAIITVVPTVFACLPPHILEIICGVMISCAGITAAVPAPTHNKILIALYQAVRILGLCVKYAIPYVATHLVSTNQTDAKE